MNPRFAMIALCLTLMTAGCCSNSTKAPGAEATGHTAPTPLQHQVDINRHAKTTIKL